MMPEAGLMRGRGHTSERFLRLCKRGLTATHFVACPDMSDTPNSLQIGSRRTWGPMAILLWQENVCCKEKGKKRAHYFQTMVVWLFP